MCTNVEHRDPGRQRRIPGDGVQVVRLLVASDELAEGAASRSSWLTILTMRCSSSYPWHHGWVQGWEKRIADAWASIDGYEDREDQFRALIDTLAAELPDDDPIAAFERACAWDSTGHSDRAVPLYRYALEHGLAGYRRRRAVIQLASSLRNVGQVATAIQMLEAERAVDPATVDEETRALGDAISAVLALCLADAGREREAVSVALAALAPHLPRYQRSMSNYARLLLASNPASR